MTIQYKSMLYTAVVIGSLVLSTATQADWCSGSSWVLFDMPLVRRVTDAKLAVAAEIDQVTNSLQKLAQDIGANNAQLAGELDREQQYIIRQTKNECQVKTVDPAEQMARRTQLRLDLGTLTVMQEVSKRLSKQVQDREVLSQNLSSHRYELQHLHQRLARLAEAKANLIEADLTLQSACTAVQSSAELRGHYSPLSREAIDQQVLQIQDILDKIPESEIAQALETCDLSSVQIQLISLMQ